jgi:membrane protein
MKKYGQLLMQAFQYWREDNAATWAAALAYYTIFSLAPLLIIAITIVGFAYGQQAAQGQIISQLTNIIGYNSAQEVQSLIQSIYKSYSSIFSPVISIIILVFGATGVFSELQNGLNTIWKAKQDFRGIKAIIKHRFLSFAMVLAISFLLLISFIITTLLSIFSNYVSSHLAIAINVGKFLDFIVSFGITTLLFGMILKILPDIYLRWKEVLIGAMITALLFTIGKFILGHYLSVSRMTTMYGVAGSLIMILLWVYYSAQIFFFGAELSKAYSMQNDTITK